MGRVKTFANGGTLLAADLNAIEDDYELAFSTYKTIIPSLVFTGQQSTSGITYILAEGGAAANVSPNLSPAGNAAASAAFYLDPAWSTAGPRTTKWNVRASLITNNTPPTSTFTFGLYPVTSFGGGTGANTLSLGTLVPSSTVTFAAPSGGGNNNSSGDFTAPASGYYAIGLAISVATMVAGSSIVARAILQQRQM